MKRPLPKLLSLFLSFLKIGAFTFGGGYAMIALLENEFVSRKKWLEKEEFLDVLAVSESTPGPIAVNTATYIGYKVAGVLGSILATLGVVLPAFTIIFVISLFFDRFLALTYVGYAFRGVQVAVVDLIASAGVRVIESLPKNLLSILLASVTMIAFVTLSLFAIRFSTIFYILIGGAVGLSVYACGVIRTRRKEKAAHDLGGENEDAPPADPAAQEEERREEK